MFWFRFAGSGVEKGQTAVQYCIQAVLNNGADTRQEEGATKLMPNWTYAQPSADTDEKKVCVRVISFTTIRPWALMSL